LVDLAELVHGHWNAVQTFYAWFGEWIDQTQAPAMAELKLLQKKHEAMVDEVSPGLREIVEYLDAHKRHETPRQPPAVRKILRAARERERRAQKRDGRGAVRQAAKAGPINPKVRRSMSRQRSDRP
jgi:hypothetical protein